MKRRFSITNAKKSYIGIAVPACAAVVAAGLAMAGWSPATTPPGTPLAQANPGPPDVSGQSHRSALFVGDSYTVGAYANTDLSYACLTATNLGWQCNVGAQPGTGYISGGDGQRLPRLLGARDQDSTSVPERFPRLRELDRADIVVLDAGRNDIQFEPVYLRNMLLYTVQRAIETWPDARIVVIAPWMLTDPDPKIRGAGDLTYGRYLEDALREDHNFDNVTFIYPGGLGWFSDLDVAPYLMPDGVHQNVAGDKLISQFLTTELMRRGFAAK